MYQLFVEHCAKEDVDAISEFLEDLGSLALTYHDNKDDPILEPEPGTAPLWPETLITAFFEELLLATHAQSILKSTFSLQSKVQALVDEDWEKRCIEDIKPQKFGERLWVSPSWEAQTARDTVNLILNPGLAFGTGTHPTTRLCLEWLSSKDLSSKTIVDYGCGSGILGLAALKLGAKKVYALDIDPQAVQATNENAALNGLDKDIEVCMPPETPSEKNDLVIANILLGPLIDLAENFHKLLKKDGLLVVTGILSEQASTLIENYKTLFIHKDSYQLADWSLLVFQKG